jgi:TolA-binding protein
MPGLRKRPQDASGELARLRAMVESVQSSLTEQIEQLRAQVRDLEERIGQVPEGAERPAGRKGEKRRMRAERRAQGAQAPAAAPDETPAAQTDGPASSASG